MTDEYIDKLLAALTIGFSVLVVILWIAALWTDNGKLGGTGALLLLPTAALAIALVWRKTYGYE